MLPVVWCLQQRADLVQQGMGASSAGDYPHIFMMRENTTTMEGSMKSLGRPPSVRHLLQDTATMIAYVNQNKSYEKERGSDQKNGISFHFCLEFCVPFENIINEFPNVDFTRIAHRL